MDESHEVSKPTTYIINESYALVTLENFIQSYPPPDHLMLSLFFTHDVSYTVAKQDFFLSGMLLWNLTMITLRITLIVLIKNYFLTQVEKTRHFSQLGTELE